MELRLDDAAEVAELAWRPLDAWLAMHKTFMHQHSYYCALVFTARRLLKQLNWRKANTKGNEYFSIIGKHSEKRASPPNARYKK